MELNELKKQWNALDNRLQQTPITRTDEVEKLIARCRHDADSGVKKLRTMQVVSLGIGVAVVLLVVLGTIWACIAGIEQTMIQKYAELLIFMAITFIGGFAWDWKTYRHIRTLRVDTMPVVEVSRRMAKLAQWTRYEIWVICIWAVLFSIVYLRTAGYHELSTARQIGYWVFMSIWFAGIYCFFYKRFNKNIAHVRKNLKELEDVCTE